MASKKGPQFERDMARALSLWWTSGKRDDVFWRTSQSGGRATQRRKGGRLTFGQSGDTSATDPIGRPLLDLVTIEFKRGYNTQTLMGALDGGKARSVWEGWVHQARRQAEAAGSPWWLLIHKRDRRRALIFLPLDLAEALPQILRENRIICITLGLRKADSILCLEWGVFLKTVLPKHILALHKIHQTIHSGKIIRVGRIER